MPRVAFTSNLKRHVDCPESDVDGDAVCQALDVVFAKCPQIRGYVLDEQGRLRTHMVIFVDGKPLNDRERLSDPVQENSDIYVMQALSGG